MICLCVLFTGETFFQLHADTVEGGEKKVLSVTLTAFYIVLSGGGNFEDIWEERQQSKERCSYQPLFPLLPGKTSH